MNMTSIDLSQAQIESYSAQGYLVLRASEHGLVDPDALQVWTEQVRSWPRVSGKWMPYDEVNADGEKQLMRTENFVDYHSKFHALLCGEGISRLLKQVSGEVCPHNSGCISAAYAI
jgi:hypothetical protein